MDLISIFSNVFYILIAILVLLLMVTVHEFGHYIAGKLLNFKINEFAIGFGPALYKKTSKKTRRQKRPQKISSKTSAIVETWKTDSTFHNSEENIPKMSCENRQNFKLLFNISHRVFNILFNTPQAWKISTNSQPKNFQRKNLKNPAAMRTFQ